MCVCVCVCVRACVCVRVCVNACVRDIRVLVLVCYCITSNGCSWWVSVCASSGFLLIFMFIFNFFNFYSSLLFTVFHWKVFDFKSLMKALKKTTKELFMLFHAFPTSFRVPPSTCVISKRSCVRRCVEVFFLNAFSHVLCMDLSCVSFMCLTCSLSSDFLCKIFLVFNSTFY